MKQSAQLLQKLSKILALSVYAIIVLVPFYAFLTTWIGDHTGGLLLLRAWKELLLSITVVLVLALTWNDKKLRTQLLKNKFAWLTGIFAVWLAAGLLFMAKDPDAALLGFTMQLRPMLFFIVAGVVAFYQKPTEALLIKLIAVPAVGVVAFGLLQMFSLPHDFLKHFGYKKGVTIPPYFTIDEQLDKLRIASTLRGPNPLGVYLIAPVITVGAYLWKRRTKFVVAVLFFIAALITAYGSHSRSAWLGLAIAALLYVWLSVSQKWKLLLLAAAIATSLLGGLTLYQQRNTDFVQDVILHDNPEEGGSISSNEGHASALQAGLRDVRENPLWGCGAGCAGPASVHNAEGSRIAENFFLQTTQEAGLIGLALLIALQGLVVIRLFCQQSWLSRAWLAVFAGVTVASLLSHAWADDTIAYLWWGIAGLLLGVGGEKTKLHQNSQT